MRAPDVQIRRATDADVASLTGLLGVQLAEHGVTLGERELRHAVEGLLRRPQLGRFLLALERDAVVGFAALAFLWTLEHGGRSAWLDELYVVPERRGRGIGASLLQAVYREASSAGAVALDLEVERGHERVESLYEREGFRPHARRRWVRPLSARV
jgi:GNAT superfamily N-acetyltransferase